MKARSKCHITIKLYKLEEAHPTTKTKNTSHKCCAAALCNNRSDNRKDLTFHVFSEDLAEAPGIYFGVTFLISESQIILVSAGLFTFFEVCDKSDGPEASFSCLRRKCVLPRDSTRRGRLGCVFLN